MRVAIDSRFLLPHVEGFGRFTREVASRLIQRYPEEEWELLFDRPPAPQYYFGPNQRTRILPPPNRHWSLYELWWHLVVPLYIQRHKPHAIFATYGVCSRAAARRLPVIAFIHDVAFARYPDFLPRDWSNYYKRAFRTSIREARLLLVNSYSVQKDIIELFGADASKIRVAPSGCDTEFFRPLPDLDKDEVRAKYTGGKRYLLYVGSIHKRKNPIRMLEAYDLLRKRYKEPLRLLIVGRFLLRDSAIKAAFQKMQHREEVIVLSYISDALLLKLYNAAEAVVYPSLYEGFGSPVAEGLACGVPVVTSEISALPETGGEAAFYADPYSPSSIAQAIYNALTQSPSERAQRAFMGREHVKNFSWDTLVNLLWLSLREATLD